MPPKPFYETAEEMQEAIDRYFQDCDKGKPREIVTKRGGVVTVNEPQPYTVEGMVHALGFKSRQSLVDYKKKGPESEEYDPEHPTFSDTIMRARLKIHAHRLEQALLGYQDSKIAALDLAVNFGMQPKLQLPEGAQIVIGYSSVPPAVTDGAQPGSTAAVKPEQITE